MTEKKFPAVDGLRRSRLRTNRYSPPVTRHGDRGQTLADYVELSYPGKRVARHERCDNRQQQILDLEHDLDVLREKPEALAGSTPLAQWRLARRDRHELIAIDEFGYVPMVDLGAEFLFRFIAERA